MLMDDPLDWQARIDSLQTAIAESLEMMWEVFEAHTDDVLNVFGAEMTDEMKTPFEAVKVALGDVTPREFLKLSAKKRPTTIPKPLRSFKKKEFYQLVYETMQLATCLQLLDALAKFAEEGFEFFLKGYYTDKNLPVAPNYPPRSIMRTIVDQVSFDLSVIQHAINQRRRLNRKATQQALSVAMADHLSKMAVSLATEEEYLPENTQIVTYLAKSVRARLVPYSDTLLISVAYASIHKGQQPSRDFLAIPHEIGHHLFWNGWHPESNMEIRDRLLQRAAEVGIGITDWRLRWLEEIFADTYALLVAGPVVVLDFQDMLDDDMSSHFREDTDKHPIPEIRPLIQTDILRQFKDASGKRVLENACNKLDKNWSDWLDKDPLTQSFAIIGASSPMSGQEIVQQLRPLISVILETLSDILPELDEDYDLGENDSLHKLYEEFQNMIMPDDDNELVEMFLDGEGTEEEVDAILASTSEVSFLQHIHNITDKKPNSIRSDEWITLLRSHGWSSEGPLGSGGRTSGGSVFNLQTDRVNGNKDVKVTVTITNGVSGTLDLKDSQSQQTHSLYCDTTGTYTFKNVGARAGYIIVTNTSPLFMVNYPSGS